MEEKLRKQALGLYEQGVGVTEIARRLNRTRQWVYKWIGRKSEIDEQWHKSHSKAPHNSPNRTPKDVEEAVIAVRRELEDHPYKESGAYPIFHELKKRGLEPPAVATINRILNRHGLTGVEKDRKASGIDYPLSPKNLHIMDLIGPCYLRGDGRFYLFTIISNDTRYAGVYPIRSKDAISVTSSVATFWKTYSIPDFLQMDNELSFKGSNRHPRSLGLLMRTALSLGVSPIFIPVGEPWRDGVIERFNQKVENTLLAQEHKDFDDLVRHAAEFTEIHNREHHYSTMGHKTPEEMVAASELPIRPLRPDYIVGTKPPIDSSNPNEIRFIRLVRSDRIISILNTGVEVTRSLVYTYVEAILKINEQKLIIRQDGEQKQTVPFEMPVS